VKFLSLLILILLVGCNSSSGDKFAALEDSAINSGETPDGPVEIESFFPTDDPVITTNAIQNFNIVVKEGGGLKVSYKFELDGVEVNLSATDINVPDRPGLQFNAYLNGVDNSDFLSESYSVASGSATAEVTFDPDCTLVGTNAVTVRVTDVWGDYEEYSMNVTVTTNGDVEIDDYTPSTATTVLTDATISFAVTVMPGAGDVNYKFELDGNEVKNSSAAFYALDGSTTALEAGAHTLVVTATNATSSATRTWNLHRNTAPEITLANETDTDIPCSGAGNTYTLNVSAMDTDTSDMSTLTFSSALNGSSSGSLANSTGPSYGIPRLAGTVFTANCSLLGSNTIRFRVTDQWGDYDDLTRTITLDGPITFATYSPTPATSGTPYLLPSSGDLTFSATIASGAGNRVSYSFELDGVEKQNNSSNFYTLQAADISAISDGLHSMVLTASKANTFSNTWNSTGLSGAYTAQVVFTPVCPADVGSHVVNVKLTDHWGATANYPFAVTVVDPVDLGISSPTPSGTTVLRENASSNSQTFSVTATGTSPITYSWSLPTGPSVGSCTTASCLVTNTGEYYGSKTLSVTVDDATAASPVSQSFTVNFNDKPVVTPNGETSTQLSCSSSTTLTATITDAYLQTSANTFTATWEVNGDAVATSVLNPSVVSGSGPYTASATFSPNCNNLYIGENSITLVISDGYESSDVATWTVDVNYFSTDCLNATSGEICTLAGIPGLSDHYDTRSTSSDFENLRIRPKNLEEYSVVNGSTTDTGLFISDTFHHVVWFFNNNPTAGAGSNNITVNGVTVAPKRIAIIAGKGVAGLGVEYPSGSLTPISGRNFYLNSPMGIAYHSSTGNLYIADYGNNRIVKLNNSGHVSGYTLAGGTSSADGALANTGVVGTSFRCKDPSDLEISNNRLYVACYGNNVAGYASIAYFNLVAGATVDQATKVVLYGVNAAGPAGGVTPATADRPFSLAKHPNEETIFFNTSVTRMGVGVINNSGGTRSYRRSSSGAKIDVDNGNVGYLIYNGVGAAATGVTLDINSASVRLQDYYDLEVKMNPIDSSILDGIFLTQDDSHNIIFANLSANTVTVGNRPISSGQIDRVMGVIGTRGGPDGSPATPYSAPAYSSTKLNQAHGLAVLGNKLYFADVFNFRVGSLVIDTANGLVTSEVGNKAPYGYDGEIDAVATTIRLSGPAALSYDSVRNRLYFSELLGNRIRYIDLNNGRIRTSLGQTSQVPTSNLVNNFSANGADTDLGGLQQENENANIRVVRDLAVAENATSILFTNSRTDSGTYSTVTLNGTFGLYLLFGYPAIASPYSAVTNQTCQLRAFNDGQSDHNVLGSALRAGFSNTYAGDFTSGCNPWLLSDGNWTTNEALPSSSTALGSEPTGVLTDDIGSSSYISMRSNHCIVKVQNNITAEVGKCNCTTSCGTATANNAGNINSNKLNSRLTFPGDMEWDSMNYSYGNFFFVDKSATTNSLIKYVNYKPFESVEPLYGGIDADGNGSADASANSVGKLNHSSIPNTLNYVWGIAVNDFMICFTQGAYAPINTAALAYAHTVTCIDRTGGSNHKTIGKQTTDPAEVVTRSSIQLGKADEGMTAGYSTSIAYPMGIAFDSDGNLYFTDYASHTIKKVKRWY